MRGLSSSCAQLAHGLEEEPYVELPRQRLGGHDSLRVVPLQQRQSGCGQRGNPRREVQVIPIRAAQVPLIFAMEEVQPAGVVLREFRDPMLLVDPCLRLRYERPVNNPGKS